jgi:hypothetical protein
MLASKFLPEVLSEAWVVKVISALSTKAHVVQAVEVRPARSVLGVFCCIEASLVSCGVERAAQILTVMANCPGRSVALCNAFSLGLIQRLVVAEEETLQHAAAMYATTVLCLQSVSLCERFGGVTCLQLRRLTAATSVSVCEHCHLLEYWSQMCNCLPKLS